MGQARETGSDLPRWFWLYAPLAFLALLYVLYGLDRISSGSTFKTVLNSELGLIENLTVVSALVSCGLALRFLWHHLGTLTPLFASYLALFALGCFFLAGEEASWGQHYFQWETPDEWEAINDQSETNIHNVYPIFDRLPKAALSLCIFVGGVIAPLRRSRSVNSIAASQGRFWWLWPTRVAIPAALIAILATLPEKLDHNFPGWIDPKMPVAGQELKECYIAFFLLIYVSSLSARFRSPVID